MNDAEFQQFAEEIKRYLENEKVFIANPKRISDVNVAVKLARELFPNAKINVEEDPLQMGCLFLCIEDFDIVVRDSARFAELTSKASNFEIYVAAEERVKFNIGFAQALVKLPESE